MYIDDRLSRATELLDRHSHCRHTVTLSGRGDSPPQDSTCPAATLHTPVC